MSQGNKWDEGLVPGFVRFDALDLCKGEVVHQHTILEGFRWRQNKTEGEVFEEIDQKLVEADELAEGGRHDGKFRGHGGKVEAKLD